MHLHTHTHYIYIYIVSVASVAADDAAVPRYRRGAWTPSTDPHDMIYQPCLLLYAISLPAVAFPLCLLPRLLDPRSAMHASHLRSVALRTLRFVQGRRMVYGACATMLADSTCEGNGSRERRLMRSRVSLAELFHEIRVSTYESRSRRFLSLGIGRTFIILRERG